MSNTTTPYEVITLASSSTRLTSQIELLELLAIGGEGYYYVSAPQLIEL